MSVLLTAAMSFGVRAAEFEARVRPAFTRACVGCHGPDKQKGGLRLDRRPDTVPTDLLHRLTTDDPDERMPPAGDRLSPAEVAAVRRWAAGGAVWPGGNTPPPHWAFRPVVRPPVPVGANPIDHFVRQRLGSAGQQPNPPADRRALIRRLTFDLHGLPPTPEAVAAFEADSSPDAYERLVDRLLAAPQYGERWARHWLDVVRYADSHGFEMNQPRPSAWPYRDWVIRSLNADLPFDRFVFEQLAGDTVGADAATGFLVAGPWDQVKSPDPVLTARQRADELHDMVGTTAAAFLGLTVGCARCHDHKFDPVSAADYYRLSAVFAGVQHGERETRPADPAKRAKELAAARKAVTDVEAELAALEPPADPAAVAPRRGPVRPRVNVERFAPVSAKFVRFVVFATNNLEPCIDELEVFTAGPTPTNVALGATTTSAGDYPGSDIHRLEHLTDGRYGNGRSWISNTPGRGRVTVEFARPESIDRIAWGRDREGRYTDRLPTRYRIDVSSDGKAWQVVASSDDRHSLGGPSPAVPPALAKREADARARLAAVTRADMVYAGKFTAPGPTHRLHRGDPTAPREPVAPGGLAAVGPRLAIPAGTPEPARRAALAQWLADPAHPLPARVMANRIWQHHFGTGLVDTPSDFGRNGGRPSHPELLDWLASELHAGGGSMKHLHRLIVTSATYRQSSAASTAGRAIDAGDRLLWRYPPRRREAEAVRDAVLFVSGSLDLKMGGPGFDLFEPNDNYVRVYTPKSRFGPTEFRRMVYQHRPRMQADDTFGAFDCPDGGQPAPRRAASTTPLQALSLLNAPFLLQQADTLAARAGTVRQVFRLAFQREPSAAELAAAEKLVAKHGLAAVCRAVLNANEFLYVD